MPLSGLIIMWNRLNAPRVRVGKEAVAAQADIDGEQLLATYAESKPRRSV
jgi:hypothetical protein